MSTHSEHYLNIAIDNLIARVAALEQQLAALQADIAAAKGEPEKAVERARVVESGGAYYVRWEGCGYWPNIGWYPDNPGQLFKDRDIAEAVAAALNAREVKP